MRSNFVFAMIVIAACKSDDPAETPDGAPRPDAVAIDAGPDAADVDANPGCLPFETDYTPRDSASANDDWPVCISDDNAYHPFDASISTVARVAAFEQIATLLFTGGVPTSQDFIDARVEYNQTNGLASRVQRREDEHYPPATWDEDGNGTPEPYTCQQLAAFPDAEAALAANADRCVGPATLSPILEAAFTVGQDDASTALEKRIAAARIEGALLWFFYVSNHKEAMTCTNTPVDCDSSFAYYTGGDPRESGKGMARYVRALDPETHDRIWDGILAVRCWRDLDNPTGVATDLEMRDRAVTQMDRAALRGVALVLRDKTADFAAEADAEAKQAIWELVRVLGPALDRDATIRDAAEAATLRGELGETDPAQVDSAAITAALDALYPCP
jgi:hypothetical protein